MDRVFKALDAVSHSISIAPLAASLTVPVVPSRWLKAKQRANMSRPQLVLENYNRDVSIRMLPQLGSQPEVLGGHTRRDSPTRNILTQSSSTALVTTGRSDPGFQIDRNCDRRLSAESSAPLGSLVSRGFQG